MQTSSINRQRGSIIIPVAVSLVVGLILLGGVQLAYYFFMKRELQNAADMAALSAVQLIEKTGELTCNNVEHPAQKAAEAIIKENFQYGVLSNMTVSCGVWDLVKYAEKEGHFTKIEDEEDNVEYNAILVDLTYDAIGFMPFSVDATITAKAIAKKGTMPVAVFSVAPALLSLEQGALTALLTKLSLDALGTNVGSYQGLANVKIKTSGLLKELLQNTGKDLDAVATVGDLNALLNTNVGLGDIVVAAIGAADQNLIDAAVLNSLLDVKAQLNNLGVKIPLGSGSNGRGLFAEIMTPSLQSALNAEIGVGDILDVVLDVATKKHALNVPLELGIGGILKASVEAKVIEPASIGIGGKGTSAYSASVRAFVDLCVDSAGTCDTEGYDSGLLRLKVDIPVGVEAVTGKATLNSLCERNDETEEKKPIADITTTSSVLGLCTGDLIKDDVFSSAFSCRDTALGNKELASLGLLGKELISLNSKAALDVLSDNDGGKDYIEGQSEVFVNPLPVGKTLDGLIKEATVNLLQGGEGVLGDDQATGSSLWNAMQAKEGCNPVPQDFAGSGWSCRKKVRDEIVTGLKTGLEGLIGNLVDNVLKGKLLTGVVKLLGDVLELVLGNPFDPCTPTALLGAPVTMEGTVTGCIGQIDEVLDDLREAEVEQGNQDVLALLALITGLLNPSLDGLGDVLSKLLDNLGVETNPVKTKLISISCDGGAQLVY
ncbi:TadG family pilus assembly protein [Advenella sp. EE-W14]|uniref:TadG family pilus assembly protein n=1 Tax=Advenella sp. EE-W14 TaxID=2722705 RepID=UPI00145CCE96|nr:TadG family pilus assembly protein [Advenella sp. EE-W14]